MSPSLKASWLRSKSGAGLPATIPEGMRALSVAVNEVVGVAGFVIPGTMVDVLATGRLTSSQSNNQDITRTILENIRVLAAGQKIEQDREGKPQTVPVITLLVNPPDAAKLAMASTQGKIQLALRNTIDTKVTDPAPVLEATLFSGRRSCAQTCQFSKSCSGSLCSRSHCRHQAMRTKALPTSDELTQGTKCPNDTENFK